MSTFGSVDQALDFAIAREQEAHDFYVDLAGRMPGPAMAKLFEDFARQEAGHRRKLEEVKRGKGLLKAEAKIMNLKIADYTAPVSPQEQMDYQNALLLAMQREKVAFRLYTDLAASADDAQMVDLFSGLANEEAKHKLHLELEYDDKILTDN